MTLCETAAAQLQHYLSTNTLCTTSEADYEVLVTPLLYPDRDNVELFLKRTETGALLVSDLGQTMMKLSEYGFMPGNAPRRRAMIFQITSSMNVRYEGGNIQVTTDEENLGARIWDLLLAVQKLSDLAFTVPAYTRATFMDEFEAYVADHHHPYERGVQLAFPTGFSCTMDFVVRETKLIHVLSAGSLG